MARRGRVVRYADRMNTDNILNDEREFLAGLVGHPDADVSAMAEEAVQGDVRALYMLHDALLDAGDEPSLAWAKRLRNLLSYGARVQNDGVTGTGGPADDVWEEAYAGDSTWKPFDERIASADDATINHHMANRPRPENPLPISHDVIGEDGKPRKMSRASHQPRHARKYAQEWDGRIPDDAPVHEPPIDQDPMGVDRLAGWGHDQAGTPYGWVNNLERESLEYRPRPDEALEGVLRYIPPKFHQALLDDPDGRQILFALLDGDDSASAALGDWLHDHGHDSKHTAGVMPFNVRDSKHDLSVRKSRELGDEGHDFMYDSSPSARPMKNRTVTDAISQVKGRRRQYAGLRSPAGGVVVRGIHYPGGKFIPAKGPEKATHEQWTKVQDQLRKYKRADGSLDIDTACRDDVIDDKGLVRYAHEDAEGHLHVTQGEKNAQDQLNNARQRRRRSQGDTRGSDHRTAEEITLPPEHQDYRDRNQYRARRGRGVTRYATQGFPSTGTEVRQGYGSQANFALLAASIQQVTRSEDVWHLAEALRHQQLDALFPLFDAIQDDPSIPDHMRAELGEAVRHVSGLSAAPAVNSGQWPQGEQIPFEAAYDAEHATIDEYRHHNASETGEPQPNLRQLNTAHAVGTAAAAGQYLNTRSGWPQQ